MSKHIILNLLALVLKINVSMLNIVTKAFRGISWRFGAFRYVESKVWARIGNAFRAAIRGIVLEQRFQGRLIYSSILFLSVIDYSYIGWLVVVGW